MNITVQVDSVPYMTKPEGAEAGRIKQRLCSSAPISLTLEDFAERITNGYSFNPAVISGGAKAENWSSQQLFCLDIDNEDKNVKGKHDKQRAADPLTPERVIERCTLWDINPALIYETLSSTPQWQKFRIVFVSGSAISDYKRAENIRAGLIELFPESDKACRNADRLFYGGKKVLYIDPAAALTEDNLTSIEHFGAFCEFSNKSTRSDSGELEKLKRDFDFLGYIRKFGGNEKSAGDRIQFNPCPICGHNDDFWFYSKTNTFMCFGASGNCGGSIIDFIMHHENMDKKSAIKYFKYTLCGIDEKRDKADYRKNQMVKRHNVIAPMSEQVTDLPAYIWEKVNERTGEITYCVSCPLLAEHFRKKYSYFWLKSQGGTKPLRYLYRHGVYCSVSDEEIKGILRDCITSFDSSILKMRDVDEAFKNLCCDNVIRNVEDLDADENIINFQNGILYLDTMALATHTPDLLSTIQIPCNWNPNATPTPVFDGYVSDLTGSDNKVAELILEYMGACISNVNGSKIKKSLFLVVRVIQESQGFVYSPKSSSVRNTVHLVAFQIWKNVLEHLRCTEKESPDLRICQQ